MLTVFMTSGPRICSCAYQDRLGGSPKNSLMAFSLAFESLFNIILIFMALIVFRTNDIVKNFH